MSENGEDKTMEQELKEENEILRVQLETAEDAINFLIMNGGGTVG